MKSKFIIVIIITALLFGCNNKPNYYELIDAAKMNGRLKYKLATIKYLNEVKVYADFDRIDAIADSIDSVHK